MHNAVPWFAVRKPAPVGQGIAHKFSLQRQAYSGQHDTPDDKTKQLEFQEDGAREHAQHNGGLHHTIQGLAEADEAQPNRLRTGQAGQPDATTARHIPNRSAP